MAPSGEERIRGCLLGGAVGDALGSPLEFLSLEEIRRRCGPAGPDDLGGITDDTQMTLFTAEGLMRAHNRMVSKGICDVPWVVWRAYLRWLHTQGVTVPDLPLNGWLVAVPGLQAQRAPGNTCLSALSGGRAGRLGEEPVNDSKGCGGVMRIAPVGLLSPGDTFEAGCALAALTHGHPSGYLAARYLAALIENLVAGEPLREAALATLERLSGPDAAECRAAVEAALDLAARGRPSAEAVESLGEGWVAEEALAIALYASLAADTFEDGVRLAVTHGGDSDSTGAIAGNILGALLGDGAIPARWLETLELRDVVETVAADLVRHRASENVTTVYGWPDVEDEEWKRYPGW